MLFLSTRELPGMFSFKEVSDKIHLIIEETNGKVPIAKEFWKEEISKKHPYTLSWIMTNEEFHYEEFLRRIFYPSIVEAQTLRLLRKYCSDYMVIRSSDYEDQNNKIDFKLVPIPSELDTIYCQIKTSSLINFKSPKILEENRKQISAIGRTAEYLSLEFNSFSFKSKEEIYSSPINFVYYMDCDLMIYKVEDADTMIQQMQKETKRKCQD